MNRAMVQLGLNKGVNMSQEKKYEKKEWVAGVDKLPGASDMNRIEEGLDRAYDEIEALQTTVGSLVKDHSLHAENIKSALEPLPDNAKVADVVAAFNKLVEAIKG